MNVFAAFALATSIAVCSNCAQAAISTSPFTTVDRPGWQSTFLSDVNSAGQIVGMSSDRSGSVSEGFVLSGSTYTAITVGAGNSTAAMGISDDGTVVGYYWNSALPESQFGFIAEGSNRSTFTIPGAAQTAIRGISPSGRYLSGHYSIVANSDSTGFVYDRLTASLFTLPPGETSLLRGVNSLGVAVGNTFFPTTGVVADSISGLLDLYPEVLGQAPKLRDITDSGYLVGFTSNSMIVGKPGNWALIGREAGMTNVLAQGINENLTIVGSWTDATGLSHGFMTSVVPEPPTYALMIAGVLLLAASKRRSA